MAREPIDPWHHPRAALAERYLQAFELGLQSAWGVFAKRRMGKTEFLNKDLLPAAKKRGYLTAYANLWGNKDDPAQTIVVAIATAIEPKGLDKVLERLHTPLKKVKASGKVGGLDEANLEAEFGEKGAVADSLLAEILRKFDKTKKKLLIAVDEAQVLASKEHSNFAHALRAALDTRKTTIKVIFAGSSETTLRRMFARPSEPFYNWAPLEAFELLGRDFVEDMVEKVNRLSRFPLEVRFALKAFERLHMTPDFFRRFLTRYLTHAQMGADAALESTKAEVANDKEYVNVWGGLLEADKEVLKILAGGMKDLHGKAARERLGSVLGLGGAASMNTPAQALKRLQAETILTRLEHGEYRFEDEGFKDWVMALP